MNRVLNVARLHLIAWPSSVGWPWGILALSFLVNLGIFTSLESEMTDHGGFTGGLLSIYVVQFVVFIQIMTRGLPFAMGHSVTRRSYYLGTWVYAVLQALVYSALLYVLLRIEEATNGWGASMEYFGLGLFQQESVVLQYVMFVVPFLLAAALGLCAGLVMRRWGTNGVFTLWAAVIAIAGAAAIFLTWQNAWEKVGNWFADQSAVGLLAAWPLLLTLALTGAGYAVIRRVTP